MSWSGSGMPQRAWMLLWYFEQKVWKNWSVIERQKWRQSVGQVRLPTSWSARLK